MALKITEECINCDVCAPVCPNDAIYQGEIIFEIKPDHCTECVGHFSEPQCVAICPVDCIILDTACVEDTDQLQEKYNRLIKAKKDTANE
jgi:ferredoxin